MRQSVRDLGLLLLIAGSGAVGGFITGAMLTPPTVRMQHDVPEAPEASRKYEYVDVWVFQGRPEKPAGRNR